MAEKTEAVVFGRWRTKYYYFGMTDSTMVVLNWVPIIFIPLVSLVPLACCVAKIRLATGHFFLGALRPRFVGVRPLIRAVSSLHSGQKQPNPTLPNTSLLLWRPHQGAVRVVSFRIAPTNAHIVLFFL